MISSVMLPNYMTSPSQSDENLQEVIKAYERYSEEIKKLTKQQGDLLKELLAIYASQKMNKIDKKIPE